MNTEHHCLLRSQIGFSNITLTLVALLSIAACELGLEEPPPDGLTEEELKLWLEEQTDGEVVFEYESFDDECYDIEGNLIPCEAFCGDGTCDDEEDCSTCASDCGGCVEIVSICGDGRLDEARGEECDDGNFDEGDGCNRYCQIEICGDGFMDEGEECDDGNLVAGDGCNPICRAEVCGNGRIDTGEACDDGNSDEMDGCTSLCRRPTCGDGIFQPGEFCDDGNDVAGDGCDVACRSEICGNGRIDFGEECDDGNDRNDDLCLTSCKQARCGDGIQNAREECDDGNLTFNDGCTPDCQVEVCGDGIRQSDEECDDGNRRDGDGCSGTCVVEYCGDGMTNNGEQCDDANDDEEDGCLSDCTVEDTTDDGGDCFLTGRCEDIVEQMDCPANVRYRSITVGGIDDFQGAENEGDPAFYEMDNQAGQDPRLPAFDNNGRVDEYTRADIAFENIGEVKCVAYFARIKSLNSLWETDSSSVTIGQSVEADFSCAEQNCWDDQMTTRAACSMRMSSFAEPEGDNFITTFTTCGEEFIAGLNDERNDHLYFHSQDDHAVDYLQLVIGYTP